MQPTKLACIMAVVFLVTAVIPSPLAAQDNQDHKNAKHHQYRFVDLGTFGGSSSYFTIVGTRAVNNQGTATGAADTSIPDPYAPNCFFPECLVAHTFAYESGQITDLGSLPGVNNSGPNDINSQGVIVGISENGAIDPITGLPETVAVVWKNGQIITLPNFGGNFSYANAINNREQIAGFALNTTLDSFGFAEFCFNPPFGQEQVAVIWQDEIPQNLGTLGGPDSCALWINEKGQAAGHSMTNAVINPVTGFPTVDPFIWDHGKMLDLGTLGGTLGLANKMNNRGQVVGQSNLAGDLTAHPFLWDRGSLIDLGTLGGTFGLASSVSDSGIIVGGATNQNDQSFLAFLWKNGVMTNLGTLAGDDCSVANNVNSGGQVVGSSFPCAGGPSRGFLWQSGSIFDLNAYVPAGSDLTLSEATFVNDRGEITAQGVASNGDQHAVLLIPCGGCIVAEAKTAATENSRVPSDRPPSDAAATWRSRLARRLGRRHYIPSVVAPRN